jgi:hypothetical protein
MYTVNHRTMTHNEPYIEFTSLFVFFFISTFIVLSSLNFYALFTTTYLPISHHRLHIQFAYIQLIKLSSSYRLRIFKMPPQFKKLGPELVIEEYNDHSIFQIPRDKVYIPILLYLRTFSLLLHNIAYATSYYN